MHARAAACGGRCEGRDGHREQAKGAGKRASAFRSRDPLLAFVKCDREPRHQHDVMRAFLMATRSHAKTGQLSEVLSKLKVYKILIHHVNSCSNIAVQYTSVWNMPHQEGKIFDRMEEEVDRDTSTDNFVFLVRKPLHY